MCVLRGGGGGGGEEADRVVYTNFKSITLTDHDQPLLFVESDLGIHRLQ